MLSAAFRILRVDKVIEAERRIYASIIGSDNASSPVQHQAIIRADASLLASECLENRFTQTTPMLTHEYSFSNVICT